MTPPPENQPSPSAIHTPSAPTLDHLNDLEIFLSLLQRLAEDDKFYKGILKAMDNRFNLNNVKEVRQAVKALKIKKEALKGSKFYEGEPLTPIKAIKIKLEVKQALNKRGGAYVANWEPEERSPGAETSGVFIRVTKVKFKETLLRYVRKVSLNIIKCVRIWLN